MSRNILGTYGSFKKLATMLGRCANTFDGNMHHDFQLDITETIILGLSTTAIVGTGSGKNQMSAGEVQ